MEWFDFDRLPMVRQVLNYHAGQDHCRWLFKGRLPHSSEPVLIKIWNPEYVRGNTIPAAIEAGFYSAETVPALRGLVMSNGRCRGYVMAVCQHRIRMSRRFFQLVCQRTIDTGFFAVQFSPSHTMRLNGRLSMIDLEGVYPTSCIDLVRKHFSAFAYRPYAKFLAAAMKIPMPPVEPSRSPGERLIGQLKRVGRRDVPKEGFKPELILK